MSQLGTGAAAVVRQAVTAAAELAEQAKGQGPVQPARVSASTKRDSARLDSVTRKGSLPRRDSGRRSFEQRSSLKDRPSLKIPSISVMQLRPSQGETAVTMALKAADAAAKLAEEADAQETEERRATHATVSLPPNVARLIRDAAEAATQRAHEEEAAKREREGKGKGAAEGEAPSTAQPFFEVDVERQRILTVLDQLVDRLEVALCLPLLAQHADNTRRNLFFGEAEKALLAACSEYSSTPPRVPKDQARGEVPRLEDALGESLHETRDKVLRSTGRLKAVRKLEKAIKKKQEEEIKAQLSLTDDQKEVLEDERDESGRDSDEERERNETVANEEDADTHSKESHESSSSNASVDDSIFSVGSDNPFSVAGYSSSYFSEGKTSAADKERAEATIKEMLRRRAEKIARRKEAEKTKHSQRLLSGFWGRDSRLEARAAARLLPKSVGAGAGLASGPGGGDGGGGGGGGGGGEGGGAGAGAAAGAGDAPDIGQPLPFACGPRLDGRIARLVDNLYARPLLRKAVKQFLLPEISEAGKVFLEYARGLRECAEQRLRRTPREEAAREEQLRRVYARNAEATLELQRLEQKLLETKMAGDKQLAQRADDVDHYEQRIERLVSRHKADMTKKENASERAMVMEWKNSQTRQMALEQELTDLEEHLKTLRESNLAAEAEMRNRRTRLEQQLEAVIGNYDYDMTGRQNELDKLTKELEEERLVLTALKDQLRDQEEEYEKLIQDRSEEEEEAFQRALWKFLTNRSARVIQRAWRAYHARRMAKRKARKAKGKGKGKGKGKEGKGKKKK